jgi:transposase
MGSEVISNQGKKALAHKMKFEGVKLKVIALELQVSLATVNRWMKSYDEREQKHEAENEVLRKILEGI